MRREFGGGDGFGVLFRLAQVDGDDEVAVRRCRRPFHVLCDAVAADVVGVLGKLIIPVRSRLGRLGIEGGEFRPHRMGAGRQDAHELRIQ